jgi:hypothetical protein
LWKSVIYHPQAFTRSVDLSETLRKIGCRLLEASVGAMDFAFGTGSGTGIIGSVLLVFALSYLVGGAI